MKLINRVAVITGASRGIGRAIAQQLALEQVKLVLVARTVKELQDLAGDIRKKGGAAIGVQADIADEQAVKAVISHAIREFGRIDILINNAGIGLFKPTEHISVAEWDRMMSVNVKGSFLLCREVIPHMRNQGSGHILTIASEASRRTFEQGALYCATKYAQDAFSSALKKEVRGYGIKVSSVYPGVVDTYFNNSPQADIHKTDRLKPADVAQAVTYILQAPSHVVIDELMIHPIAQEY